MKQESFSPDSFDQALIDLLKRDGRMSFTDIARSLGVAVSTVRNRYNKLSEEGVLHILGWLDPVKAGYNSYNRITIDVRPSSVRDNVIQELMRIEEVAFLAVTSGGADLEINLICKDHSHFQEVMKSKIHTIQGVYNTTSTIYYQVYKWANYELDPNTAKSSDHVQTT